MSSMRALGVSVAMLLALGACDDGANLSGSPRDPGGAVGDAGDDGAVVPELDAGPESPLDAGPAPDVDAGPIPMPDAGSGPVDAGPPGCGAVSVRGSCSGPRATWCEGDAVREEDCAASGQVCGATPAGQLRCVAPPEDDCADPVEQEQLRITNEERVGRGLAALRCDPGLARSARLHSQDMCNQNYFSHTSLDGRTMRDRINAQGVTWTRIGENIARGQATPAAVHTSWMNSSGHRANILSTNYGRIGIGHVACPAGRGPYWTQNFAN